MQPRFAGQGVDAFCRACHGAVDKSHFPLGNAPVAGTTCLNCHRTHGRSLFFPSLRDDYPAVIAESTGINPHGGKIFCLACHPDTPQAGAPPSFRFPGNQLRLCQRCHDDVEHHPLGVKSTTATWKMDFARFPLENGAVTCVTCHDPPECRGTAPAPGDAAFLRGGPFEASAQFCARCPSRAGRSACTSPVSSERREGRARFGVPAPRPRARHGRGCGSP